MLNTKTGANFQGNCKVTPESYITVSTSILESSPSDNSALEVPRESIALHSDEDRFDTYSEDEDTYEQLTS